MFTKSQRYYDAIYGSMKDYGAEAAAVDALVQRERPGARTLLDVGCGTGAHHPHLGTRYDVTGIDLDPEMVAIARDRNPAGTYAVADMTSLDLGRRFDAVLCMFSSIGYVCTPDGLRATLDRLAAHVTPDGVVIVEPWFTPDTWKPGPPFATFVDEPELKIARMSVSPPADGRISIVRFAYLVATRDGFERFDEEHRLGLFTIEEHLEAFAAAGLDVRFEEGGGPTGRGLYVARPVA